MDQIYAILRPILDWIAKTFSLGGTGNPDLWAFVILCAVAVLVIFLLVLFICLIVKGSKRKKLAKQEVSSPKAVEEKKEEKAEEPVEEKVDESKVEEVSNVEEAKEEPKKEVKEEVVKEQPVEEKPVEEKVEEVKKEVKEVKEEKPAVEKKPVSKRGSEKKVAPRPKAEKAKKAEKVEKAEGDTPKASLKGQGKFVISQDGDNYRYRLKASNGELLVVSELYSNEESCRKGIETLKKNLSNDTAKIEFIEDKHGLFSFRVMTKQGRTLATSANYKTEARSKSASESAKRWAATERIEVEESNEDHSEVEEFTEVVEQIEGGKFKIINEDEKYTYQLIASNGQVIATSQVYKSLTTCKDALENFRKLAYEGKFYIFKDKNGKFQYKLYNKQKRMILAGEVYDDKARATAVITSIKRFAGNAKVVTE